METTERNTHVTRLRILLFCYMAVLLYYLLFSERDYAAVGYNIVPFAEISRYITYRHSLGMRLVLINLGGNILGFIPFGLLLPDRNPKAVRMIRACLIFFLFSLIVEGIQWITHMGCFDVDDILLNTLGGVFGYGIRLIIARTRRNKGDTKKETSR